MHNCRNVSSYQRYTNHLPHMMDSVYTQIINSFTVNDKTKGHRLYNFFKLDRLLMTVVPSLLKRRQH